MAYIMRDRNDLNRFFFSSRRRHTNWNCDWSSDVCSSDLWEELARVRSAVLVKLEEARNAKSIGGSLEAKVSLYSSLPKLQNTLKVYAKHLPALFIVSQVEILDAAPSATNPAESAGLAVQIEKADGNKCERCWNYS